MAAAAFDGAAAAGAAGTGSSPDVGDLKLFLGLASHVAECDGVEKRALKAPPLGSSSEKAGPPLPRTPPRSRPRVPHSCRSASPAIGRTRKGLVSSGDSDDDDARSVSSRATTWYPADAEQRPATAARRKPSAIRSSPYGPVLPVVEETSTSPDDVGASPQGEMDAEVGGSEEPSLLCSLALKAQRAGNEVAELEQRLADQAALMSQQESFAVGKVKSEMMVQAQRAEMAVAAARAQALTDVSMSGVMLESEMQSRVQAAQRAAQAAEIAAAVQQQAAADAERLITARAKEAISSVATRCETQSRASADELASLRYTLERARAEVGAAVAAQQREAVLAASMEGRAQEAERSEYRASTLLLEARQQEEALRRSLFDVELRDSQAGIAAASASHGAVISLQQELIAERQRTTASEALLRASAEHPDLPSHFWKPNFCASSLKIALPA